MEGKLSGLMLLAAFVLLCMLSYASPSSDWSQTSSRSNGDEQELRDRRTINYDHHHGILNVVSKAGGGGGGGRGGGSSGGKGGGSIGGKGGGSKGGGSKRGDNGGKNDGDHSGTVGGWSTRIGGRRGVSGTGGESRRSSAEPSTYIRNGSWRSALALVMLTTLYIVT